MAQTKKVSVIAPSRKQSIERKKLRACGYARVSTDHQEQEDSLQFQISNLTDILSNDPNYIFVGIFSDAGITGTTDKRPDFQRMILKAVAGEIDMIYTKSISRFSRNTADLLRYTQQLKNSNVDVYFMEEKISLLSSGGTIMLTVLGAIAQMESENTSAHVKHVLQDKMRRGELVGQADCYGYKVDGGELVIVPEEAEVVRYIFARYIAGAGGRTIARELTNRGVKTRKGNAIWQDSTVLQMIRNEKYTGKLIQGKTITVNPVGHVRVINDGISNQYEIENNHPAIISKEDFFKAQEILKTRTESYADNRQAGIKRFSHQYTFSSKIKCGYCGGNYSRRTLHGGTKNSKPIWQCTNYVRKTKAACPYSKTVKEEDLEKAFVEFLRWASDDSLSFYIDPQYFDTVIDNITEKKSDLDKIADQLRRQKKQLESKWDKLLDMRLEGTVTIDEFTKKRNELNEQIKLVSEKINAVEEDIKNEEESKKAKTEIRQMIINNDIEAFNPELFRAVVDHVIIGGRDDPTEISFVLNTDAISTNLSPEKSYLGIEKNKPASLTDGFVDLEAFAEENDDAENTTTEDDTEDDNDDGNSSGNNPAEGALSSSEKVFQANKQHTSRL